MIKINELRIGNLIYQEFGEVVEYWRVNRDGTSWVEKFSSMERSVETSNPIPLTEEWLLKFGYIPTIDGLNRNFKYGLLNGFCLHKYEEDLFWDFQIGGASEDERNEHINVYYVHQLQNLYFALTGEELKIK